MTEAMTNEELYIIQKMGRKNPFKVPEGYFDSFADQLMQQLPEEAPRRRALLVRIRPLLYAAAACVLLAVICVSIYNTSFGEQPVVAQVAENESNETYIDEAADYAMVDNYEIYACLMNE
jgi:hypothetical protein